MWSYIYISVCLIISLFTTQGRFLRLRGVHINKHISVHQTLHGQSFWARIIEIKLSELSKL